MTGPDHLRMRAADYRALGQERTEPETRERDHYVAIEITIREVARALETDDPPRTLRHKAGEWRALGEEWTTPTGSTHTLCRTVSVALAEIADALDSGAA